MSEPRRPEPVLHLTERTRERVGTARETVAMRRRPAGLVPDEGNDVGNEGITRGPQVGQPGFFGLLIAIGSALLALGGLWAWQTWSNRSAQPIDDLLPILAAGTDEGSDSVVLSDDSIATATAVDGSLTVAVGDPPPDGGDASAEQAQMTTPAEQIIVHVSGAVRTPGVVVVVAGARVYEAIDLAGGVTERADLDRLNLAAPMLDGERIHVPTEGEEVPPVLMSTLRPATPAAEDDADPIIDVNLASESELEELPGVGPSIARAIVQTRQDRGPFLDLDELLDVPGIGEAKLAQLRPFAVVGP